MLFLIGCRQEKRVIADEPLTVKWRTKCGSAQSLFVTLYACSVTSQALAKVGVHLWDKYGVPQGCVDTWIEP